MRGVFFALRRLVRFSATALVAGLGVVIVERVERAVRRLGGVVPRTAAFFPAAFDRPAPAVDFLDFVPADPALRAPFVLEVAGLERFFVAVRLATGIAHSCASSDQHRSLFQIKGHNKQNH